MSDKAVVLAFLIGVLLLWIVVVAVWKTSKAQLSAWREIITKGDTAYFINQLGEKAFVKVLAVDRSRARAIQVELMIGGDITTPWVDAAELYPAPTPTEDN